MQPEELKSAVNAGIISEEIAQRLSTHLNQHNVQTTTADEESFRLVSGFNDIFVVISCLMLIIPLAWIIGREATFLGAFTAAATAWGLSEFFVRKRKMALPAIVLLLVFVMGLYTGSLSLVSKSVIEQLFLPSKTQAWSLINFVPIVICSLGTWLHWIRFKVPISVAAGSVVIAGLFITSLPKSWFIWALICSGLAIFYMALRWDSQDTERKTRKSDVAFWLHLAAAPMIVHPIFFAMGVADSNITLHQAVIVLIVYFLLAMVSLVVDRRALMVSALGYVLYAMSSAFEKLGAIEVSFALTAVVIGSGLLILSAFWRQTRHFLMLFIPVRLKSYFPKDAQS